MIILLVANDIDHFINGVVFEAHLCGADVLRHVDTGAIGTQQQLLIETCVGEVGPHRAIFLAEEESFGQSFFHLFLTNEIGLRFVVDLVERHAQRTIGLIETLVHPVVHHLPQRAYLFVALFPAHQHVVSLADERSFLFGTLLVHACGDELLHFLTIMLVEEHVVIPDEVISLLAR